MSSGQDAYHELCGYTLTHGDATFIHQHVVWRAFDGCRERIVALLKEHEVDGVASAYRDRIR